MKKKPEPQKKVKKSDLTHAITALPKWIIWFIGAMAFLLYVNTLSNGFALDDIAVIEQNAFVQDGFAGIPDILTTFYWQGYWELNTGLFRPISLLMFAIEHALSPDSPMIHHFMNVLFYALSCMLLFRVLQMLFKSVNARFFLLVTLLFAANPIHTEVVANIKSRDEIMAFFFFLATCYYLYRNAQRTARDSIFATLFFLLALLSKEGVIALFPLLFLLEYRKEGKFLQRIRGVLPLVAISVLWFAWHQYVIGKTPLVGYTYHDNGLLAAHSIAEQKATALGMFFQYELKAFYPYLMSYDYAFPQIPIIGFGAPLALLGMAALLVSLGLFAYFYKRVFLLSFALALILLPLLMTGNLIYPIGATMADRFLYIPALGAAIFLTFGISALFRSKVDTGFVFGKIGLTLTPLILLFAVQTVARNNAWTDNETLFTTDVLQTPNSARTQYNNAKIMEIRANGDTLRSEYKLAIAGYERCLELDKGYSEAYVNLGTLYLKQKNARKAQTVFNNGVKNCLTDPNILGGLGEAYFMLQEKDSAYRYVSLALDAGNTLAGVYLIKGTVEFERNDFESANETFSAAAAKYPTNTNIRINYGNALGMSKNYQGALEQFSKVLTIDPNNVQVLYYMAMSYEQLGDTDKAKQYFDAWKAKGGK